MNRYRAFGCVIESAFDIDELPAAGESDAVDLRIVERPIGRPMPGHDAPPVFDYGDPGGTVMIWPHVAGFRICAEGLIEVQPADTMVPGHLALPLLGPVIGWWLHLRGKLVLHASAVVWRGRAVAFMGDKLAGKSTTAATFLRDGGELLTDDLLVFNLSNPGTAMIEPAFAQLKLSDEAASEVQVEGAEALPLVMEGFPKRQHRLRSLAQDAARCDALFVLNRHDGDAAVRWADPAEALTAIMRFSYNVRFGAAPLELQDRAGQFRRYAALSKATRVGTLSVPANLSRLDEVLMAVEGVLPRTPPC